MNYTLNQISFFKEIEDSKNILLAGAGGGFDIYSGIPLYFNLLSQNKNVIIGNLSFTLLEETTAKPVCPNCYNINSGDTDLSGNNYFPEKYLKIWFGFQGLSPTIYAFNRVGPKPLTKAYKYIAKNHNIDTVILVDGGTDSLMFGDEDGLGTPQEDVSSMIAAYKSGIKKQLLASIGFGVDHYHGVSHYRFLQNVAEMVKDGGYLGLFHLTNEMDEAKKMIDAVLFSNQKMPHIPSIVANSIVSAIQGEYGDYHKTYRTKNSELWINPLMSIYWSFDLRKLVRKLKYYHFVKDAKTINEFNQKLIEYRSGLDKLREKKQIPI